MNKEDFAYAFVGVFLGLVAGFLIANWVAKSAGIVAQPAASAPPGAAGPINPNQELPPNHPPISGETTPAPPLSSGANPAGGAVDPANMPSLDPLPASSREKRAEQGYKNIQMLKGVPAENIMAIMNSFKAALGVDCTYCHVGTDYEKDDKPMKKVARQMIQLTRNSNAQMAGAARVTCFTCHRGQPRPPA